MRVLIVEDEPLARERIRTLLATERDVEIVGEAGDGRTAVNRIRALDPDLVFLDVNMPEMDGLGVIETIGADGMPPVIFVTAYDKFAVQAFDAHALDYLLKPFEEDRFREGLDRARQAMRQQRADSLDARLTDLIDDLRRTRGFDRIAVKSGGRIRMLRTEDVEWVTAEGNYVRLHVGEKSWLIRETMSNLEERLDPSRFLRIHRSTIVNADAIRELEPLFQGDYVVILKNGTRLTSSRGYRTRMQEFMNQR